jgi:hypothetical protein
VTHGSFMTSIPTPLRIAIGFIIAFWIVGLTALAVGAPGEIVVATAAIGTVGALVEWSSHRPDSQEGEAADTASTAAELQHEPAPQPLTRSKH